jgi:hypothetical protein
MTDSASRILHSVAADMVISTRIVANSIKVLQQYRLDSLLTMNKVMADATKFTKAHGIVAELPALALALYCVMQPDEAAADEPTTDRNERFRVQVFNVCMDTVIAQLSDRFAEDKIPLRYRCNPLLRGN